MAYASKYDDEEQPGIPKQLSSEASPISSGQGGGGSMSSPAAPQEKGGSQFPDISRYLTQNEPGAQRLAAKYAGTVSQAGNQARDQISNLSNTTNQQIQSGVVPLDQGLANRASSNPTSFFNFPQPYQAPPATPPAPTVTVAPTPRAPGRPNQSNPSAAILPYVTRGRPPTPTREAPLPNNPYQSTVTPPTATPTVANQSDFNQLQTMRNANYTGPTDLASQPGYAGAQSAAQNANQLATGTQTDEGRRDFLRGLYGGGVSSPGVSTLDNLLLQGREPTNVLRNASAQNTGIPGMLSSANTQAQGLANQAQATDASTSKAVTDALQGTYGTFHDDYQKRLGEGQTAARNEAIARIPGGNNGPVDQKLAGMGFQPTTNVASEQDYQLLQALNALLGTNYGL